VRRRRPGALIVAALAACSLGAAVVPAPTAASAAPRRAKTTPALTVSGFVTPDLAAAAELGARARLARADARSGVAGRRVVYAGTETVTGDAARDAAAVARLASSSFAVVPALTGGFDTALLARAGLPYVGTATARSWAGDRYATPITGTPPSLETSRADPELGRQLRALLGASRGRRAVVVTSGDDAGRAVGARAQLSLGAAGFTVGAPVAVAPGAVPDASVAATVANGGPDVAVVALPPPATTALAAALARAGFTGAVVAPDAMYDPADPGAADGLTVLSTIVPLEQRTAALGRLVADVRAVSPDAPIRRATIDAYLATDRFLAALARTGRSPTRAAYLRATAGGAGWSVPGVVGRSTVPAMRDEPLPCGAAVQSDGTRWYVVEPYRCGAPVVSRRPRGGTPPSS
jgi:hypothetical protein